MADTDFILLLAAFVKWAKGEPLTVGDLERILNLLNTMPLQVGSPNRDIVEAKFAQMRQIINARYGPQKQ